MKSSLNNIKSHLETILALLALVFSGLVFLKEQAQTNRIYDLETKVNLELGELLIHPATDFCIARGFRTFPSDHIIIPITFENTGSGAKTAERLTLLFEHSDTGETYRFYMKGYIPQLDRSTFGEQFDMASAVMVPERSVQRYLIVFQIENWWDRKTDNYKFQFHNITGGINRMEIRLGYFKLGDSSPTYWQDPEGNSTFLSMPIYQAINNLTLEASLLDYLRKDPELEYFIDFLGAQETSDYNADCFPAGDYSIFS